MDKEKIIKALECFASQPNFSNCVGCYFETKGICEQNCSSDLADIVLQLIKELIKENEDLKYDIDSSVILLKKQSEESRIEHQNQMRMLDEIYDGIVQLRVNIVRKIQEDVAIYFGTYTDKDEVKVSDVIRVISRITEEILEEADNVNLQGLYSSCSLCGLCTEFQRCSG